METSVCRNCRRQIFLGLGECPSDPYEKYNISWMSITWRHMKTKNHICEITVAEPVGVKKTRNDDLDEILVEKIRQGIPVTSGGDRETKNSLLRLRRNGIIFNQGSKQKPKWVLKEKSHGKQV
jgi:hypothetical protein